MCKEKLGIQIFSNGFMLGKFFSIIRSDGVHLFFDRIQQVDGGSLYLLSGFVRQPGNQALSGFAFYQRKQDSLMMSANDGINFPITDA